MLKKWLENKSNKLNLTTLGFTLIELLAVILILAVILVIAVLNIMIIIDKAKKDAFVSSAQLIVSSVEKTYFNNLSTNNLGNIIVIYEAEEMIVYPNDIIIDYTGKNPESGVILYENGLAIYSVYNNNYCVSKLEEQGGIIVEEISKKECIEKVIYKQDSVPYNNVTHDPNLENGIGGWQGVYSSLSMVEENLRATIARSDVTWASIRLPSQYQTPYLHQVGLTFYGRATIRVSDEANYIRFNLVRGTGGHNRTIAEKHDPLPNEWYELSGVTTITSSDENANVGYVFWHGYNSDGNIGKYIEKQPGSILLNLTSLGLEHLTTEEMEYMTANWFAENNSILEPVGNDIFKINPFNKLWLDTNTNTLKKYTGSDWIEI